MYIEISIKRPLVTITIIYIVLIMTFTWIGDQFYKKNDKEIRCRIEVTGIIDSEPSRTDRGFSFLFRAKMLMRGPKEVPFSEKLRVSVVSADKEFNYGDELRLQGLFSSGKQASNPGEFDYGGHLERQGVAGALFVNAEKDKTELLTANRGNPFVAGAIALKKKIRQVFLRTLPKEYCDLLGSIIFGIKASPISEEVKDKYRRTGVVHILVASGQQVSILAGLCISIGRFAKMPFMPVAAIASFSVWSFAAMAGFGSSILRAALMGQVMIASLLLDRENDFYSSFALAALVLLAIDPNNLFDIGFQLSFLATWALVYIAPILNEQFSKIFPGLLSRALSISIAPVMVTAPIGIFYFSQLSLVSVVANMIVVPMAEMLTTLGFISSLLGLIFFPAAQVLNSFMLVLMFILENAVKFFSSIPDSFIYIAKPSVLLIIAYYLFIFHFIEVIKNNRIKMRSAAAVVLVLLLSFPVCGAVFASNDLEITVLDVGQGDSIFLREPGGGSMLIDGGEEKAGEKTVVPFLQRKGINKLDIVVLTHPHDDHIGGMVPVLETFKVSDILDSGFPFMTGTYKDLLDIVRQKNIRYQTVKEGQRFRFGKARVTILGPPEQFIEGTLSDPNNNSIVLKIDYGKRSFLLTGDAAFEEEEKILLSGADIKCDVLKIGHHGSATSTGDEFLDLAAPSAAVISVGERNKYGHPSGRVIRLLGDRGIRTFRTDRNGAVMIKSDGENIKIESVK